MLAKRKTIADTAPPNGFIALEWRRRVFSTATTVERNSGHRASAHESENGPLSAHASPDEHCDHTRLERMSKT